MTALTPNARKVLERRYLRRDARGRVDETPEGLFARVAAAVAAAEARWDPGEVGVWRARFEEALSSLVFLPNSPALMNAGTPDGQLFACFVVPVGRTEAEVERALDAMAEVQRTGGGTGFSFSDLPAVGTDGGPGVVATMARFDLVTERVSQGGRRRGANMGVLRADHPEVRAFVAAKRGTAGLRNFNLSVGVPDAFMEAAGAGRPWALRDPARGTPVAAVDAASLLEEIADAAWATGDPGLVFLDAIARSNPTPHLGRIEATNPCGEVPLLPWESCDLGSVNLARLLSADGRDLDWARLEDVSALAVRFLDDALEVNRFPSGPFAAAAHRTRKVGVGVMGLAELLLRLGIPYASDEAAALAGRVMARIEGATRAASVALAKARGAHPAWAAGGGGGEPVRNATRTSVAPTGTISLIAGTTAGIEPLFALAWRRHHVLGDDTLEHLDPILVERLGAEGLRRPDILDHVRRHGTLPSGDGELSPLRRLFASAPEIPWRRHLAVQAAVQRHVDNAVSKTVNLPETATPATVADVFREAWRLGLKGVTVFRQGSERDRTLQWGLSCPPCED